ncbi:MAG: tRNA (adenosine(37)-N6)-dimethylallyltransferase MiaA [Planctomycetales bacterium]|nr:tRNA (adenosine(37)-N6)-dimethylallyltransferase MiaA [Planctomycetales bacterium]
MTSPQLSQDCWFLTGPTASGKTAIGLELAERLDAEIISLDSMAIYRGMNIGTAKPTGEQLARVPHHLVDIVEPTDAYSVSDYVAAAEETIREIRNRGREVLFVGGTPLYLKALLRGMFDGPPGDVPFREQIMAEAATVGTEALHDRLALVDPLSAAKLHRNDLRRIVRALEVYRVTGQPISHQQLQFDEGKPAESCRVFVLNWPRTVLHQRINERVAHMFELGLVAEVRELLERHGDLGKTANQAVGYRETIRHLREGIDLEQTIRDTQTRTRQFAKRQMTWFRSLRECRWVSRSTDDDPTEIVDEIVRDGRSLA